MKTKLVVGLGNFPPEYNNTKHNVGFQAIDHFCNSKSIVLNNEKFNGVFAKIKAQDNTIIIAKPFTYMNLSGNFVQEICNFYKIDISDVLVIYDDLDTKIGKFRIKTSGSSGGQNGIKNIIEKLGSEEIKRIRIGIDRPSNKNFSISDYVLSKFSNPEKEIITPIFDTIDAIIFDFICDIPFAKIINKYTQSILI